MCAQTPELLPKPYIPTAEPYSLNPTNSDISMNNWVVEKRSQKNLNKLLTSNLQTLNARQGFFLASPILASALAGGHFSVMEMAAELKPQHKEGAFGGGEGLRWLRGSPGGTGFKF